MWNSIILPPTHLPVHLHLSSNILPLFLCLNVQWIPIPDSNYFSYLLHHQFPPPSWIFSSVYKLTIIPLMLKNKHKSFLRLIIPLSYNPIHLFSFTAKRGRRIGCNCYLHVLFPVLSHIRFLSGFCQHYIHLAHVQVYSDSHVGKI